MGAPPTIEACKPQHCHLFFDSTGGQDDSQIFCPEGLLGASLPRAPWGQPQSLFGSYPAFSPSYPTLAHSSPYHKVVFQ